MNHTAYLKDIYYKKDDYPPSKPKNNTTCENGQTVMIKNHACQAFALEYLMDYWVLKILNESTLLLVTPNGKRT